MQAFVAGIGLHASGLDGWDASRAILTGAQAWSAAELSPPVPTLLAANERRRAGLPVRLALSVSEQAVRMSGLDLGAVRGVFGSANGEGAILHQLLETLASDMPRVSPTMFHNSVHNAVAGYWAVAAQSRQPMTCLGAHADSFAATLLKACAELHAEQEPVLMCVYDAPMPDPLAAKQPTTGVFACALVLTPDATQSALARLVTQWQAASPGDDRPHDAALAALSRANPAARSLRLLQGIARAHEMGLSDEAAFTLLDGIVMTRVDPC